MFPSWFAVILLRGLKSCRCQGANFISILTHNLLPLLWRFCGCCVLYVKKRQISIFGENYDMSKVNHFGVTSRPLEVGRSCSCWMEVASLKTLFGSVFPVLRPIRPHWSAFLFLWTQETRGDMWNESNRSDGLRKREVRDIWDCSRIRKRWTAIDRRAYSRTLQGIDRECWKCSSMVHENEPSKSSRGRLSPSVSLMTLQ